MAVTDFDTKVAVEVREDLATWQRLNVTAFLMSGITAHAGAAAIGEPYRDGDGREYLPLLVQPVLVFSADRSKLHTVRERAQRRDLHVALYTADMFQTGNDDDNRAAVRAVATAALDLVGLAIRAPHRDADAVWHGTPERTVHMTPAAPVATVRRLGCRNSPRRRHVSPL